MRAHVILAFALLVGCGGDDGGGGAKVANKPAQKRAVKKKNDKTTKLTPRMHVEDRVACQVPERPTGPPCEPLDAPQKGGKMFADCEPGLYCLQVGTGYNCEPCPERDTIRHEFKDRDFVAEQERDPFFSFIIVPSGIGRTTTNEKPEPHQSCKRPDQFVALDYSYQDLKLVGIVAQGTQRKVLMMDTANFGHIIKRGDCVGKEKAVVKDIGTGYVTFVVDEDPDLKRPAQETSVQLHPGGIESETQPQDLPSPTPSATTPIVTPSGESKAPVQVVTPPSAPKQ
jgi:hypothetical protein